MSKMSKMSELYLVVAELHKCGETLIGISESLADLFSEKANAEPIQEQPQPETKVLKLEDVRAVLAEKSRNGFTAEVRALLGKYGANKLSEISPEKYADLFLEAEVLGNG